MGIATGNPTWEDYPSTDTPITADRLNRIETAIDGSMPGEDDNYVTDAEKAALHSHANKAALDNVSGVNTGDQDLSGLATTAALTAGLADKADATHGHAISDVTGLQSALDGKQASGSYAAASHNHDGTYAPALGADDNYVTDSEKAALHTHPAVIAQGDTAAAARAAIGAGTSDLVIGTTSTTAKAGNYTPPAATTTAQGIVELATTAEATTGTDTARAVTPAALKAVADTKANATHTHTLADVTDYTPPDLSGYATTTALTSGLSGKANATHTHAPADITGTAVITTDPRLSDARTPTAHSHAIAQVTGLQTALDGKQAAGSYAAASHTHTASQVSDSTATGRSVLTAADAAAARTAIGAGTSNLALGTTSTTAKAGNYTPPAATTTVQGVVELATTAEATTGTDTARAVTPAGLKAVADTKAAATHSHAISDVSGLQTALDGKQPAGSYAPANHNHDSAYAAATHTHAYADLTGKPTIPTAPGDIGAAPATQPINARTGSYSLIASDAGKLVTVNSSSAATVTVPASTFTAGQRVDVLDLGAERVTFVAGAGMTLGGTPSLVSRAQYSAHSIIFLSASQAVVVGDLEAAE